MWEAQNACDYEEVDYYNALLAAGWEAHKMTTRYLVNGVERVVGDTWEAPDFNGVRRRYMLGPGGRVVTSPISPQDEGPGPGDLNMLAVRDRTPGPSRPVLSTSAFTRNQPARCSFALDETQVREQLFDPHNAFRWTSGVGPFGFPMESREMGAALETLMRQGSGRQLQLIADVPGVTIQFDRDVRTQQIVITFRADDGEALMRAYRGESPPRPMAYSVGGIMDGIPTTRMRGENVRATRDDLFRRDEPPKPTVPLPAITHDANSPRRLKSKRKEAPNHEPHGQHQGNQDSVDLGTARRRKRTKRHGR